MQHFSSFFSYVYTSNTALCHLFIFFQIFYLPLAFAIPPAQLLVHQHFNLLYQFWIHTETIKTLGPLEYIFNTPQHHRVHHGQEMRFYYVLYALAPNKTIVISGSNIYCLDKNYGGVLIIWDRMFGTFSKERNDEEIVYGLVFNQPSFNPLFLQVINEM